MSTPQLDNIDQRLTQLVAATEGLLRVAQEQGGQQREQFSQQMVALQQLQQITERQAENISRQTENVKNLTAAVTSLARSVDTLAKSNPPMLETSRRAVRASESTELLTTRILDELRDLIEQLRPQG